MPPEVDLCVFCSAAGALQLRLFCKPLATLARLAVLLFPFSLLVSRLLSLFPSHSLNTTFIQFAFIFSIVHLDYHAPFAQDLARYDPTILT